MFFAVVQPMASAASSDDTLKLIGLHPDNFFNTLVTPELQTEYWKKVSELVKIQNVESNIQGLEKEHPEEQLNLLHLTVQTKSKGIFLKKFVTNLVSMAYIIYSLRPKISVVLGVGHGN